MINYKEQLIVLDQIRISDNATKRINCPFCGGHNTFTISKKNGKRLWNCYKASCPIAGSTATSMSKDTIVNRLSKNEVSIKKIINRIPEYLSDPAAHKVSLNYLIKNNCLEAHEKNRIFIRYSVKEGRVLFFNKNKTGATGRSLYNLKPKWKVFGDLSGLITIGAGETGVIVEDVASAAAISNISGFFGCALLGTNISLQQRLQLFQFKELIVALDKDAALKGLKIKKLFENQVKTRFLFLEKDFKNLNNNEINKILRE